ncbi:MAG: hypothetical protein FJ130_01625 [Deltaproteobacteria bacterium]|nr:hypothetical protein [Deltaproteobacteria bacterium]
MDHPWRSLKYGKYRYERAKPIESQPWKPDISTETTAKEEMRMTLLICITRSDTNNRSGRRYSSYGTNAFFS